MRTTDKEKEKERKPWGPFLHCILCFGVCVFLHTPGTSQSSGTDDDTNQFAFEIFEWVFYTWTMQVFSIRRLCSTICSAVTLPTHVVHGLKMTMKWWHCLQLQSFVLHYVLNCFITIIFIQTFKLLNGSIDILHLHISRFINEQNKLLTCRHFWSFLLLSCGLLQRHFPYYRGDVIKRSIVNFYTLYSNLYLPSLLSSV